MWPRWNKTSPPPPPRGSPTAVEPDSAPRTPSRLRSSFSFKDVHSLLLLLLDDSNPNPNRPVPSRKASIFHRVRIASAVLRTWKSLPPGAGAGAGDRRIVVYYTSLRGFRVAVDERDLSMDSGFLGELKGILGRRQLPLPRVFIGGRHVGGAEEVQLLHESGELRKLVEGLPAAEAGTCEACAGFRFALCGSCNGSHKCYHSEKAAFRTCSACNENGLVRCPACCSDR